VLGCHILIRTSCACQSPNDYESSFLGSLKTLLHWCNLASANTLRQHFDTISLAILNMPQQDFFMWDMGHPSGWGAQTKLWIKKLLMTPGRKGSRNCVNPWQKQNGEMIINVMVNDLFLIFWGSCTYFICEKLMSQVVVLKQKIVVKRSASTAINVKTLLLQSETAT